MNRRELVGLMGLSAGNFALAGRVCAVAWLACGLCKAVCGRRAVLVEMVKQAR